MARDPDRPEYVIGSARGKSLPSIWLHPVTPTHAVNLLSPRLSLFLASFTVSLIAAPLLWRYSHIWVRLEPIHLRLTRRSIYTATPPTLSLTVLPDRLAFE